MGAVRIGTATLPRPAPLRLGPLEITEREYAAVEVETEDGLVGKAYCLSRNAPVAACVKRLVAPVVMGREAEVGGSRRTDGAFAACRLGHASVSADTATSGLAPPVALCQCCRGRRKSQAGKSLL